MIVGKWGHTPPFSKISSFLEIQDVPTFCRPIGKTKVLNDSLWLEPPLPPLIKMRPENGVTRGGGGGGTKCFARKRG